MMPLLVYPILSLVFQNFLFNNVSPVTDDGPMKFSIAFESNLDNQTSKMVLADIERRVRASEISTAIAHKDQTDQKTPQENKPPTSADATQLPYTVIDGDGSSIALFGQHEWRFSFTRSDGEKVPLAEVVASGETDAGIKLKFDAANKRPVLTSVHIFQREDGISRAAAKYLVQVFNTVNMQEMKSVLASSNRIHPIARPQLKTVRIDQQQDDKGGIAGMLASLIPLALVLMTVTGAVYPAIDLTAGERERGTLETLMASPVPRMSILFAKFIAVVTVAVMTAILNLAGMSLVMWVFQLDKMLPDGGFSFAILGKVFLLLVLFAAFFAACLLMVTSFARSFKEAQAYLVPIVLFSLAPGLLAMSPSVQLAGLTSVTPMMNLLVLARDIIQGQASLGPAVLAVVSTLVYAFVAISIAARMFGADSILYTQQQGISGILSRPRRTSNLVPIVWALLSLVLLLPINMVSIGVLGRLAKSLEGNFSMYCLLMGSFTLLSFFVVPLVIAWFRKVNISEGFGVKSTSPWFFVAAILLGISLWPLVMVAVEGTYSLYSMLAGETAATDRRDVLVQLSSQYVEKFRQVHPLLIALCFSLIPAASEEWFFRGMLQRALLKEWKPRTAIVASSVLFGVFHILSSSAVSLDRFLPTMLIGLLLGYLAFRSRSILPGIILHATHNAIVVFLGYCEPALTRAGWLGEDGSTIRLTYIVPISLIVVAVAVLLIVRAGKTTRAATDTAAIPSP